MAHLRRALFLVLPLFFWSCNTTSSLPERMPADFMFSYEMRTISSDAEGGESEPSGESGEAAAKSAPATDPTHVLVEIDNEGIVSYRIEFKEPQPATNAGKLELETDELEKVYGIVRAAKVLEMEKGVRYTGDETQLGRRTFYVRGMNHFRSIEVVATRVPSLDTMWAGVREILLAKAEELLDFPKAIFTRFVFDRRTKTFHRNDCELVPGIPQDMRAEYATWQECLNQDGEPCPECHPMQLR
jgi:hypothetical protein